MIEIPFSPQEHNFIVIRGVVYRARKQRIVDFLIDTGASTTMIDPIIMQSIGYTENCEEYVKPASVSGPSGKENGYMVKTQRVLIHSVKCALNDIDIVCIRPEKNVEALLGLNFLSKFHYCIDHKNHIMTLNPA
jgi:clan AA aspartic protease (TIGR02281 family)